MKTILFFLLLLPTLSHAKYLLHYGLNYSTEGTESSGSESERTRIFHKVMLGKSFNRRDTLFLGLNINSWSLTSSTSSTETEFSMLEVGPRLMWYWDDTYRAYFSLDWNPYAKGEDDNSEYSGSSFGAGVGYRFKISSMFGIGAGMYYHSLTLKEKTTGSTDTKIDLTYKNIMPMIELTLLTK
jgi:outer membrane protein assembly factor BamA